MKKGEKKITYLVITGWRGEGKSKQHIKWDIKNLIKKKGRLKSKIGKT
jgi:hypothetical protein